MDKNVIATPKTTMIKMKVSKGKVLEFEFGFGVEVGG